MSDRISFKRYDSIRCVTSLGEIYYGFFYGYMESNYNNVDKCYCFSTVILYKGTNFKKSLNCEKEERFIGHKIGYPLFKVKDLRTKIYSCRLVIFEKCIFEDCYLGP